MKKNYLKLICFATIILSLLAVSMASHAGVKSDEEETLTDESYVLALRCKQKRCVPGNLISFRARCDSDADCK